MARLDDLKDKYSRDKWPMYSTFYIIKGVSGRLLIAERVYATYDSPDWYDHEYLTPQEALWMHTYSDVKLRWGTELG